MPVDYILLMSVLYVNICECSPLTLSTVIFVEIFLSLSPPPLSLAIQPTWNTRILTKKNHLAVEFLCKEHLYKAYCEEFSKPQSVLTSRL